MSKQDLTYAEAHRLFEYEPASGLLIRRVDAGNVKAGTIAGTADERGRLRVRAKGQVYLVHRVIWLLMTGEWPVDQVDHDNGVPSDNRWKNLRAATSMQNAWNTGKTASNTSGYRGVTWNKRAQKWQARITFDGDEYHLGLFDTPEEASERYQHAAAVFFGEFARKE